MSTTNRYVLIGILTVVSGGALSAQAQRVSEEEAKSILAKFSEELAREEISIFKDELVVNHGEEGAEQRIDEYVEGAWEKYGVSMEEYGETVWLVEIYDRSMAPAISYEYFIDARGQIRESSMEVLNEIFQNEYPDDLSDEERAQLIEQFVQLDTRDYCIIINDVSDIPDYEKSPLEPEIEKILLGPKEFIGTHFAVYTYQKVGGSVDRYIFEFEDGKKFKKAVSKHIAGGIGDWFAYQ